MRIARIHPARRSLLALTVAALLAALLFAALPAPAEAAGLPEAPGDETIIPMAPADEGGAGMSGSGASEWLPFAVLLGPFLVVITGLLWLTFRIDASEAEEE
ncbi:MAG: hypothetical protein OXG38_11460 [Chloroflexi bacterium]|nr:hypothetical protein [Chloroflexota bacterium]